MLLLLLLLTLALAAPQHVPSSVSAQHRLSRSWQTRNRLHVPSVPRHVLDRARTHLGDESRLRHLARKLLRGQQVKFAVLGSSLATCRGASALDTGWPALFHKWLELSFTPCGAALPDMRFDLSDPDYWFRRERHLCNASTIQYVDMAMYASTPIFSEKCMLPHVPQDVDLVIIEYGVNDLLYTSEYEPSTGDAYQPLAGASRLLGTSERAALERMLRTLLQLPGRPAVVLFEAYAFPVAARLGVPHAFGLLPQDLHMVLAQWYGNVQVLSARSVMYPLLWHGRHSNPTPATPDPGGAGSTPHMTVEELTEDQVARSGLFQDDLIHPTDKGHRIYAEILINYLQGILLHEELLASLDSRLQLPHHSSTNSYPANHMLRTSAQQSGEARGLLNALPPPFIHNNWESEVSSCFLNQDVAPLITQLQGFEFKDEGGTLGNGMVRHKYGYVASQAGAMLSLTLNTFPPPALLEGGVAPARVQLLISHLRSYQGMGSASVACVSGCLCMPLSINAHNSMNVSLTSFAKLEVSPHQRCQLQVKVSQEPGPDGGHKFKFMGVVVSHAALHPEVPLMTDHDDYLEAKASGQQPGGW